MACFLVPTAEAIVTGVVSKVEKKNEAAVEGKIPFSRKLKWLKNMLWGGAALLAYEHVWHGEVVLVPVFDGCGKSGGCGSYAARDGDRRRDDGTSGHGCVGLHFARRG